ncbi:MAG: SUMF1/EgtB/PvdO family nonheme iron enzyme [Verrucomicrobiota bacterium JB023]|nr:SUMF1/EgtB/PvdO family nonheme iron enzyme [Verrucomicrobiota bacterium JB023]
MSHDLSELAPGVVLGDYELVEILENSADRVIWLARQQSVKRQVEIHFYLGDDRELFLETVRVKASVDDGVMGLVYEVIEEGHLLGFTREHLKGESLQEMAERGARLTPLEISRIIRTIAASLERLEVRGLGQCRLDSSRVKLDERQVIRMDNIASPVLDSSMGEARHSIAETLRTILQLGQPGATRMSSLLDYIEGTGGRQVLPWSEIKRLADQVCQQLTEPASPPAAIEEPATKVRKSNALLVMWLAIAFAMVLMGGFFFFLTPPEQKPRVDEIVFIPEGRYPRPNGGLVELPAFRMDAHEVTIGEYHEFLMAYRDMDDDERKELAMPTQPPAKTSYRPENWQTIYRAALENGTHDGRSYSLNVPVTGIDWWDAHAFASWRNGSLPTELQWWAACTRSTAKGESPEWSEVASLDSETPRGLKGNAAEWLRESSVNPAFPMNHPQPVAAGGSYLRPEAGAMSREWLDSKSVRRADLGFRLVYEIPE